MSGEDCAPGALMAVFINCIVDGWWQRRRLGVMNVYAAFVRNGDSFLFQESQPMDLLATLSTVIFWFVAGALPGRLLID